MSCFLGCLNGPRFTTEMGVVFNVEKFSQAYVFKLLKGENGYG